MSEKSYTVAVVIPTFNEALRIFKTLEGIPRVHVHKNLISNFDIIVVDDGSTDTTCDEARKSNGVTVISHTINLGAGGATRTGIHYALKHGYEYIVTMDADGQHLIEDVLRVVAESIQKKYDFAIGTRLINTLGMPWFKIIGNKGLSFLTWLIIGVYSTDSQSGLRFLTKKGAESITWRIDRFGFCSEMLLSARRHHFLVHEIPIRAFYDEYSKGKGQSNWNAINILKSLLSARLRSVMYE